MMTLDELRVRYKAAYATVWRAEKRARAAGSEVLAADLADVLILLMDLKDVAKSALDAEAVVADAQPRLLDVPERAIYG